MAMEIRLSSLIAPPFFALHGDVRRGDHAEYWLRGGRGSGKSSFISIEIVLGMLRDPAASAVIFRKVAETMRESVYAQMLWAIEKLGVKPYFREKVSPMEITYLPTGQKILFRGADDPGKSKSIRPRSGYFGYLWFEELSEFSGMEDILTIRASIIRGGGRGRVFCSYNPPRSQRDWVNAEALIPRPGRLVHVSDYRGMPPGWLGEGFLDAAEALKASNERAYRHLYLGEATGSGGQVFDNLRLREVREEELLSLDRFYNGLDFGFAVDPDALARWGCDRAGSRLVMAGEYRLAHTPIDDLARYARDLCAREVIRCDSADPRMISELKRRGVNAVSARKGPGSVEHGIRWLQDLGEIVIDPARCPGAAREFSTYEYARERGGNFLAEFPDKDNHLIDATRYALEPVMADSRLKTMDKALLGL